MGVGTALKNLTAKIAKELRKVRKEEARSQELEAKS
jgi:hypothetical protein